MSSTRAETPPGYLHLGEEAWVEIRAEYQGGATAKEVARKWGIAASTVYDHAQKGGWARGRSRGAGAQA